MVVDAGAAAVFGWVRLWLSSRRLYHSPTVKKMAEALARPTDVSHPNGVCLSTAARALKYFNEYREKLWPSMHVKFTKPPEVECKGGGSSCVFLLHLRLEPTSGGPFRKCTFAECAKCFKFQLNGTISLPYMVRKHSEKTCKGNYNKKERARLRMREYEKRRPKRKHVKVEGGDGQERVRRIRKRAENNDDFFVLDPDLERTVTLCLKKMREGAIL